MTLKKWPYYNELIKKITNKYGDEYKVVTAPGPKEIIDATVMSKKALLAFLEREIMDAKKQGILLSLHMKATMMKVSDPIIFGHAVSPNF